MKTTKLSIFIFTTFLLCGCRSLQLTSEVTDTGKSLQYKIGDKPTFTYNYQTIYPPFGIDTVYKRSGFIHPLRTIGGEILTNLSPADHYHHFGLWYAWTKTTFEGNEIDFWNLNKKQGTVRFRQFNRISNNGFNATLDHIVFPDSPAEKVAMHEELTIKTGRASLPGYYIDYNVTLTCAGDSPITFEPHRYGGLVIRTREDWNTTSAEMTTSGGYNQSTADGTHAKWAYFQGKAGKENACILILSNPSNLNHPEPLRVWDEKVNPPKGDVMWNFSPTKEQPFTLLPGNSLKLRYRIYIFDDKINKVQAESLWKKYSKK